MGRRFDIPWEGVQYNVGNTNGFDIPWVGDSIYHMQGFLNTMGRGFDMPWIGSSTYNRQGVRYTMGRRSICHG